jgi:RNA polymerase sigma-70 factor, ECF subfamily
MGNAMPPNADDTARTEVQRLFIEHLDRIRGYVRAILPDPDQAGDVVQEVFLAVSARAADYDATRSFEARAFGFARNRVLEVARKARPQAQPLAADVLDVLTVSAPDLALSAEEQRRLRECISRLAPKARAIVEHAYRQGLKPHQIATFIGWTSVGHKTACGSRSAGRGLSSAGVFRNRLPQQVRHERRADSQRR